METKNQFTFKWVSEAASSFIKKLEIIYKKKKIILILGQENSITKSLQKLCKCFIFKKEFFNSMPLGEFKYSTSWCLKYKYYQTSKWSNKSFSCFITFYINLKSLILISEHFPPWKKSTILKVYSLSPQMFVNVLRKLAKISNLKSIFHGSKVHCQLT